MNCFSQEDTGRRGSRPILASDGEHLDTRMLAKFVNFDPQSDDCSRHLDCDAHAWSMRKFSVGHPETGRPPHVSISAGERAGTNGMAAFSHQSIHR
jgi:hypothetical protein